jgi:hypothetical protein
VSETNSNDLREWRLAPFTRDVVFYTFFALVFLLSGILTAIHVIPYRMGLVSFLVLLLIPLYRFKVDSVTLGFSLLVLAICVSAAVNGSSLLDLVVFLRIPAFAFLTYFLADRYLTRDNSARIFRLLFILGYIQLPVVVAELAIARYFPSLIEGRIAPIDFDFGTFNWSGDSSMSLFLVLLVAVLLFVPKVRSLTARPLLTCAYLSLTVLIAHSSFSHMMLLFVWFAYVAIVVTRRQVGASGRFLLAIAFVLGFAVFTQITRGSFVSEVGQGIDEVESGVDRYLSGSYSRGGALSYFWSQGLSLFGDGPSRYYNPITRVRLRGNYGHFFTFYSEVGLFGWGTSVLVFLLMALERRASNRLSWVGLLLFALIQMLSFTLEIMNDISAVFAYVLIAQYYLLPEAPELPDAERRDRPT